MSENSRGVLANAVDDDDDTMMVSRLAFCNPLVR